MGSKLPWGVQQTRRPFEISHRLDRPKPDLWLLQIPPLCTIAFGH